MTTIILVIFFFSIVQSLFGMGLLVFGTPTLILLGYTFLESLNILLPASLMISLLQVTETPISKLTDKNSFFIWCLPALGISLYILVTYNYTIHIELILAAMLIFSASLSFSKRFENHLRGIVTTFPRSWMIIMGVIHGFSNLGGGVLSVIANARFNKKEYIRGFVAFCYLAFSLLQITILSISGTFVVNYSLLLYPAISGGVYYFIGRRIFYSTKNDTYKLIFGGFMLLYGVILAIKGFQ